MKTVIATPLYPPDIGGAAPYVKELAKQLSENHHITIVAYGRLPEEVPGVSFISVDKQRPLPLRLIHFTLVLLNAVRGADVLYAENGPSVELPAGLVALFTKAPLIMHIGDKAAYEYGRRHFFRRAVENFAFHRAKKVIDESPLERPEILPLEPFPQSAFNAYEESWKRHIANLEDIFEHATV